MIDFSHHHLNNGLEVIIHEDDATETAVLNILYKVGSKNEDPARTGFAHLFEHLMFGGSSHIPHFDDPLQKVGGESNAFTNPDITNYYITIPANNLETAFWLESDRMLSLNISTPVLEVQKKVVVEEFNQRYLNQPYGDAWFKLREMAYRIHPYKWPTIGRDVEHIRQATLEEVQHFYHTFYRPDNAILVVGGKVKEKQVMALAEKYFGEIVANGQTHVSTIAVEPAQTAARHQEHQACVPSDMIYKAYHMDGRLSSGYHAADLISDLMGRGNSSLLYERLVKQQSIFTSITAFITGSVDPGLLVVQAKVDEQTDIEKADALLNEEIDHFRKGNFDDSELQKVKNQAEASIVFSEVEVITRTMNLAQAAALGDPDLVNQETALIQQVSPELIKDTAGQILEPENGSTLWYRAEKK